MYLAIDVGGTKTLVATLDDTGVILEQYRFPTPKTYREFKKIIGETVDNLSTKKFVACGIGVPGRVDRERGTIEALGNLPWEDEPIQHDISKLVGCPVVVDNDANLGGLSEAMLLKKQYNKVLYMTIGTGIGIGIIVNQAIEPNLADAEGGKMLLEHKGRIVEWESFAGGRAIYERFHKQAKDITSDADWKRIAHDVALGLIDLITVIQPEVIVLGGGVSTYFERLAKPLQEELNRYSTPLVPIPPLKQASRPEAAVVYGCFDLAKSIYGNATA